MMAMVTAIKRACDSCHRRKIKCQSDGPNPVPCRSCSASSIACTFDAIPQKKGPKGDRAKVLTQIRHEQRRTPPSLPSSSMVTLASGAAVLADARTEGLLQPPIMEFCARLYIDRLYPIYPILAPVSLESTLRHSEADPEAYCLMAALVAFVILQLNIAIPLDLVPSPLASMQGCVVAGMIANESIRMQSLTSKYDHHSYSSVRTSFFLYMCNLALDKQGAAWGHLREATTQAVLLNMHKSESYRDDPEDASEKRALYWQLLIAERTQALQKYRPITLSNPLQPPIVTEADAGYLESHDVGLHLLADMYKLFDQSFIDLWNEGEAFSDDRQLLSMQMHLSKLNSEFSGADVQPALAVDIRATQCWLHTILWQMSKRGHDLRTRAGIRAIAPQFPFDAVHDMMVHITSFPRDGIELNGRILLDKLYHIASSLIEGVAYVQSPSPMDPEPILSNLLTFVSTLQGADSHHYQLLVSKTAQTLPGLSISPSLAGTSTISPPPLPNVSTQQSAGPNPMVAFPQPNQGSHFTGYYPNDASAQISNETHSANPVQHGAFGPPRIEATPIYAFSPPSASHSSGSTPSNHVPTPSSLESNSNPNIPHVSSQQPFLNSPAPIQQPHPIHPIQQQYFPMSPPPPHQYAPQTVQGFPPPSVAASFGNAEAPDPVNPIYSTANLASSRGGGTSGEYQGYYGG